MKKINKRIKKIIILSTLSINLLGCTKEQPKVNNKTQTMQAPLGGIDISSHNEYINWERLNKNYKYIILRSNFGTNEDEKFSENLEKIEETDLSLGIYCLNTVMGSNYENIEDYTKDVIEQANKTIDMIKEENITHPVYLNLESNRISFEKHFTKKQLEILIRVWNKKITENGYKPGIIMNEDTNKHITSLIDIDENIDLKIIKYTENDLIKLNTSIKEKNKIKTKYKKENI